MGTALEMEAFLYGALQPDAHDHDMIAHALNESYSDDERLVTGDGTGE